MQAYLFVHFREKTTPDGEQVYFGLSKDGFHWEAVNEGNPVLWGVLRRQRRPRFYDCAMRGAQKILYFCDGSEPFLWNAQSISSLLGGDRTERQQASVGMGIGGTPSTGRSSGWGRYRGLKVSAVSGHQKSILHDRENKDYVLHWSSSCADDDYKKRKRFITAGRQTLKHFTAPQVLYRREDGDMIDSAIYEEDGYYYLFVKSGYDPEYVQLLRSKQVTGTYELIEEFSRCMEKLETGKYEAPTAMKLPDGTWSLYLDYYGVPGERTGLCTVSGRLPGRRTFRAVGCGIFLPIWF